jgi:D-alanine--poly(phosphoribitol) ligase subunit 1
MAGLKPLGRTDDLPQPRWTDAGGAMIWRLPDPLAEAITRTARRAGVGQASVLAAALSLLAARLHGTDRVRVGAAAIFLEPGRGLTDLLQALEGACAGAEEGADRVLHVECEAAAPPPGQRRAAAWAQLVAGAQGDLIHLHLGPAGEGDGSPPADEDAWIAIADMARAILLRIGDAGPATTLGEMSGLPASWSRRIVEDWNGTAAPLPPGETISSLFEKQAARSPEAPALWYRGRSMSYRDLDAGSDALARILQEDGGVKRGDIVAIALDRSFDMVVGLLAILKTGGAYLPFDRALPEERIRSMFAQAGVDVLLTSASAGTKLAGLARTVFHLDRIDYGTRAAGVSRPAGAAEADAGERIAYVNFTSGSTGAPKGVLVPHRGVIRLLTGADYTDLSERTRTLQLAPPSFDALTFELWAPLLHGGCCVLYDGAFPMLPKLKRTIEEGGVTTVFVTTALFNAIIDEAPDIFASVGHVLTGGEAHSLRHMQHAMALLPGTKLSSVYGPTETTTFASHYPLDGLRAEHASVPLGRAIRNTGLYVLDGGGRLCPPGVTGEIHITGPGLALGYLGRPDLTAERFLTALPFLPDGEKAYRTGDLGWYDCDGNVHFLGRADTQVKLNGFRIELGEIEHVLMTLPQVSRASVFMAQNRNGAFLLAAVVGRPEDETPIVQVLKRKLPSYMIPSKFAFYDALPLTAHGKVDRSRIVSEAE